MFCLQTTGFEPITLWLQATALSFHTIWLGHFERERVLSFIKTHFFQPCIFPTYEWIHIALGRMEG